MTKNKMKRLLRHFVPRNDVRGGFTLFELLVSISIIAILVALATTSYSAAQKKARDVRRIQDMESVRKAQEQWYMMNKSTYRMDCVSGHQWKDASENVVFVYPTDPKNDETYFYNGVYLSACGPNVYCMCAKLENSTGNSPRGTDCLDLNVTNGGFYCVKNQQ